MNFSKTCNYRMEVNKVKYFQDDKDNGLEIFNSRYFKTGKLVMSFSGLWPYQHPFKRFLKAFFFVIVCTVASISQVIDVFYALIKNHTFNNLTLFGLVQKNFFVVESLNNFFSTVFIPSRYLPYTNTITLNTIDQS